MDNTILIIVIVGLLGSFIGLVLLYMHKKATGLALRLLTEKHGRVLRERDALSTRVRCQRERLHILEKGEARRAKALEKLVDVAWDVFEFQTDDKGLRRDFAEAFEAYTGKTLGSLGPSAAVETSEEVAGRKAFEEELAGKLHNALLADAFDLLGRESQTKADVVGAPTAEEGGGK